VIEGALQTHPAAFAGSLGGATDFRDPVGVVRSRTPEPQPVQGLQPLGEDGDPRALRHRLQARMVADAVPDLVADGLTIAVGELLANALRHGGGVSAVRAGHADGRFVCEVSDAGEGVRDPFAGYLPPGARQVTGAGLWVARQLTAKLELLPRTSDRPAAVRVWA
jgi:anti-sigma regulatory factor (Ser/Thr protein kinase)